MKEREAARAWWEGVALTEARCDACGKAVPKGEGYIVPSDEFFRGSWWRDKFSPWLRKEAGDTAPFFFYLRTAGTDWLLCRDCFLEHKADGKLMERAGRILDRLAGELYEELRKGGKADLEKARRVADIRDFLLYLVLDGLEDAGLAGKLLPLLRKLEAGSRTHQQFFFTLSELLKVRHEIKEVPAEKAARADFERSWRETREELGI